MPDAYIDMNVAPINRGDAKIVAWEYEDNLAAPGNGYSIIIPDEVQHLSLTASFSGGGTGKVQTTTSTLEVVKTGTNIVWVDWDNGTVAITTQNACYPVTAVRMVQIHAGTMKLEVRAQ